MSYLATSDRTSLLLITSNAGITEVFIRETAAVVVPLYPRIGSIGEVCGARDNVAFDWKGVWCTTQYIAEVNIRRLVVKTCSIQNTLVLQFLIYYYKN